MKYETLQSGNYYHIFNQGNNKENIFLESENYTYFLNLMKTHITSVAIVFSYCLLNNHFHLLVKIKEVENEKTVSNSFSNLFNAYAKSVNKKYNRTGSLFRDRFKRKRITEEKYLRNLVVYINLNPVFHEFVSNPVEYKYSSYLGLISNNKTLLAREEVISLFGDKENFINHLQHKKLEFDQKLLSLTFE